MNLEDIFIEIARNIGGVSSNNFSQKIRPSSPKNTLFTNLSTPNNSLFSDYNFWPHPYSDKSTDTQSDNFFLNSINDKIYFPTEPVSIQSSCSVPDSDLIAFMNSTNKDKINKGKGKDKRKKKRGGKKKK